MGAPLANTGAYAREHKGAGHGRDAGPGSSLWRGAPPRTRAGPAWEGGAPRGPGNYRLILRCALPSNEPEETGPAWPEAAKSRRGLGKTMEKKSKPPGKKTSKSIYLKRQA